ncbi:MbtH family NRPS accessory protein [Streptomyces varsoviensis]|uniref:MbtH family NRPS accessory protein n=1 Tax=Streptomyces varsoviensis TaxID=67373 RepID=UPI0033FA19D6
MIVAFNVTGLYLVLVGPSGAPEIWPAFIDVPPDWTVSLGASSRAACVEHIDTWYGGVPEEPAAVAA